MLRAKNAPIIQMAAPKTEKKPLHKALRVVLKIDSLLIGVSIQDPGDINE
jgi:hypothetical protein